MGSLEKCATSKQCAVVDFDEWSEECKHVKFVLM